MTPLLWFCKIVHAARHAARKWFYRRLGTTIGENVRLYGGIDGVNPDRITIGDNTVIAKAAQLITHCPVRGNAPVRIGKNCYVGYGAVVLPGVAIGDNCIIGAGSIVTHDIPPNTIAYGNPARFRRHRNAAELERTVRQVETGQTVGREPWPHIINIDPGFDGTRSRSGDPDPAIKLCNYLLPGNYCLQTEGRPCIALQGQPCKWFDEVVKPLAPYGYIERKETP